MPSTLIIGAGQSGLALSYELKQAGHDHLVVDAHEHLGDNWRLRWDSLRLFSPVRYNQLAGMAFPGKPGHLPDKDETADYLRNYAGRWGLPVQMGTRVDAVERTADGFLVRTNQGEITCRSVVVATGPYQAPALPELQQQIPENVMQIHSSAYQNPEQLPTGPCLVVGAGASGRQIGAELARTRPTTVCGRDTGRIRRRFLGLDAYWWLYKSGLMRTRRHSARGEKLYKNTFGKGDIFVGPSLKELIRESGMQHFSRLVAVADQQLIFEEGERMDMPASIVWATGFRPDYSFLPPEAVDETGHARQDLGVSTTVPDLYFMGLYFMIRLNSATMGGAARDAGDIASRILKS